MWKTIICEVDFEDNPSQVVWSGQRLRGNVYIKLGQQKLIRGIYIQLLGRGYAHWSKGKGGHRKEFIGKENYLNVQQYLIGGTSGKLALCRYFSGELLYYFLFPLKAKFNWHLGTTITHLNSNCHWSFPRPAKESTVSFDTMQTL